MGRTTFLGGLALVVVLGVAGALVFAYRRDHLDAGTLRRPRRAPDFALKTPEGAEFRLRQQRGKVVLVDGRVHAAVR
jgi:hypothetical protein